MSNKKRKDECVICKSRSCNFRIVRLEEPRFDEIACNTHIQKLCDHADETLGSHTGNYRHHISGIQNLKRGDEI